LFKIGQTNLEVPEGKLKVLKEQGYDNKELILGVRPEDIHDEPVFIETSQGTKINAHIEVAELMGAETYLYSKLEDQDFIARVDSRTDVQSGQTLDVALDLNKGHFFDIDSEERIR
ncbi:MAG TPA: TOBE domain-containing protein, partial [Bacillales bacterium]|nr:TOBE domain-containing protein [Bacillales bacterium]